MSGIDECNSAVATPGKKGFQKGNPGRPRGSRNRATILAENVLSKDIKKIAEVVSSRAVRTPRGIGEWRPIQVARVLARLPA
jgi:hypothetical protein